MLLHVFSLDAWTAGVPASISTAHSTTKKARAEFAAAIDTTTESLRPSPSPTLSPSSTETTGATGNDVAATSTSNATAQGPEIAGLGSALPSQGKGILLQAKSHERLSKAGDITAIEWCDPGELIVGTSKGLVAVLSVKNIFVQK